MSPDVPTNARDLIRLLTLTSKTAAALAGDQLVWLRLPARCTEPDESSYAMQNCCRGPAFGDVTDYQLESKLLDMHGQGDERDRHARVDALVAYYLTRCDLVGREAFSLHIRQWPTTMRVWLSP